MHIESHNWRVPAAWANVSAELAKLGKTPPDIAAASTKSDLLRVRADVRRCLAAVQESGRTDDSVMGAIHTLAGVSSEIGARLDLMDAGGEPSPASGHPGAWRNGATGEVVPVARLGDNFAQTLGVTVPAEHERGTLTEFFAGVAGGKTSPAIRAALSEGTDSAGGYGLPAYLQLDILQALAPVSALLTAGAGVALLRDGAKSYRAPRVSTIPTAAWRAEAGAVATSDPAFAVVDIVPRSLAFTFKCSRELLADSLAMEPALRVVIAQAFAKELDRAGLRGTGTAPEIRGVLNTSNIQSITNGGAGASLGTTAYANFVSALQAILAADAPTPTAAIMSPRSYTVLAGLLDTTNQPRRVPAALESWKMIATSQIPNNLTVGASTDCSEIYVADFQNFVFFMREVMSVQVVKELYAGTGEIGFVCHVRADCACLYPAAFAVATGVRP